MSQQMFTPMSQQVSSSANSQSSESTPTASSDSIDDPVVSLKKLKEMLDLGLIEQSEFDVKKAEIMSRV